MTRLQKSLSLGNFPFYWRTKEFGESDNCHDAMMLDFEMTYDHDFGFLKQQLSAELEDAIESVYHFDHNIGYLQDGAEEFKTYGLEYLEVVSDSLSVLKNESNLLKVVDVGCGGGLILNEIKKLYPNATFCGVDPSPLAKRASKKFDFGIVSDFYPPIDLEDRSAVNNADLILNYDVIEHVPDPLNILENMYADLRDNGLLIFSVPDCSSAIENGDISMCIHEHLNYFSVPSLKLLVEAAGFHNVNVFKGKHGGTLFCVAEKTRRPNHTKIAFEAEQYHAEEFQLFISKNNNLCEKLQNFLHQIGDATVGFYVPLRAIPYVTKLNITKDFKFYDDSAFFKNKVLDGFEGKQILGIEDLKNCPPNYTVVMSHAYGSIIKQKIEERSIKTNVVLIDEFYE